MCHTLVAGKSSNTCFFFLLLHYKTHHSLSLSSPVFFSLILLLPTDFLIVYVFTPVLFFCFCSDQMSMIVIR